MGKVPNGFRKGIERVPKGFRKGMGKVPNGFRKEIGKLPNGFRMEIKGLTRGEGESIMGANIPSKKANAGVICSECGTTFKNSRGLAGHMYGKHGVRHGVSGELSSLKQSIVTLVESINFLLERNDKKENLSEQKDDSDWRRYWFPKE